MSNPKSIPLHPEHGLAPACTVCPLCGEPTAEIALLGNKADKVMQELYKENYRGSPYQTVFASTPCATCVGMLKSGAIAFVEVEGLHRIVIVSGDGCRQLLSNYEEYAGRVIACESSVMDVILSADRVQ